MHHCCFACLHGIRKKQPACLLLAKPSKKKTGCTAPPANRQRAKWSSTRTTEWTSTTHAGRFHLRPSRNPTLHGDDLAPHSITISATIKTHAATQTNRAFAALLRHVTTPTLPPLRHTRPCLRHTPRKRRRIIEPQHARHMHHHTLQRVENSAHKVCEVPRLTNCHLVLQESCSAHATHHITQAPFHPLDDGASRSRGKLDAQSLRPPTDHPPTHQITQEVATSNSTNTVVHHQRWFV